MHKNTNEPQRRRLPVERMGLTGKQGRKGKKKCILREFKHLHSPCDSDESASMKFPVPHIHAVEKRDEAFSTEKPSTIRRHGLARLCGDDCLPYPV